MSGEKKTFKSVCLYYNYELGFSVLHLKASLEENIYLNEMLGMLKILVSRSIHEVRWASQHCFFHEMKRAYHISADHMIKCYPPSQNSSAETVSSGIILCF